MKRWLTGLSVIVMLLLLVSLPAMAQLNTAVRGGLGGVVYDATGSVLPSADVSISGPQGAVNSKTNAAGHFLATGLVPGEYTVKVEAAGFKSFISTKNLVVSGSTSNLDIHLTVGAVSDTVEVEAGAVQIDTENTALTTPLTDQLYQSLPLPRNVSGIFALAPGVVSGGGTDTNGNGTNPSIGGASGLENLYLVDGVNVTDQAYGGFGTYNVNFGALGTGVNLAFIKEVDIKTTAFEPQYGKAAGGIIEIVTKSGSTQFHGALAAYAGPGAWYASRNQLSALGYTTTGQTTTFSNPGYDISGEVGGYVPFAGLKNKMFFFGAFDPSVSENIVQAQKGTQSLYGYGPITEALNERSWAAKISYQPFATTNIEASSFGDPSFHNDFPITLNAPNKQSVSTRYNFGNIDTVLRVNQNITPSWIVNLSYTYNMNHFKETPTLNTYAISDHTSSPYANYGVGSYTPTHSDDYSFNVDTQKVVHFFGTHTLAVGYTYDHTNFLNQSFRTGTKYAIAGTNADGTALDSLFTSFKDSAVGKLTNATFRLYEATNSDGTASTTCTYCANYNRIPVYLSVYRGTYSTETTLARARYHVAWGNDSYQINNHFTINAGLRWEEQWFAGSLMSYLFNDNWSPRVGINYDPKGDHKTKLFFNYARYQAVLPLDAAIRQLGSELDDTKFYFAPKTDASGNMLTDSTGAPIVVTDSTHVLNGTSLGVDDSSQPTTFSAPSFASSTGEGILPGTKMEYENEYVFGIQREIKPGSMIGIRYTDRRLGRIIEDIGSQSPEGSLVDANYAGGIANVSSKSDYFHNENEVTYTAAQWKAANGSNSPGYYATKANQSSYVAPVAGCTVSNDTSVANGGYFTNYAGTAYNGACIVNASTTAGVNGADGKSDGFADPTRRYQELVVEYARNMKDNWQMRWNYRYARLWGNYEGFFRNDNGQSDPGISSLFDFTNGSLGLLGDQTTPGLLNTDRRMVFNMDVSYLISEKTPYHLSVLKGLNVGTNVRGQSGAPLSAYESHPIYENTGEVPVGGRGTKGTLPSTRQLDLHADYPVKFKQNYSLKFTIDAFNVTNSQMTANRNQNLDTAPGSSNPDYNKISSYQAPFYARASVKFEF